MRTERIRETNNGNTMRTRIITDKSHYSRKLKHKNKSIADAMDFSFSIEARKFPGKCHAHLGSLAAYPKHSSLPLFFLWQSNRGIPMYL